MTSPDSYYTFTKEYQTVFREVAQVPGTETLVEQSKRALIAYDLGRISLLGIIPGVVATNKTGNWLYAALGIATGVLVKQITDRRAQEVLERGRALITPEAITLEERIEAKV